MDDSTTKDVHVDDSGASSPGLDGAGLEESSLDHTNKSQLDRLIPVIACGAGLFSDGYCNQVIGSVNTILGILYPTEYKNSSASANVSSIAFAGTVVGMLFFGYTSDHYSRKWSLLASTVILIIFAALGAGSYGAGGSISGLFAALAAYRFFLGIGIGGEYPAGSVACAESTGELKRGTRNRWFIMFTNVQIDFGFVVAAITPMILVLIFTENHLRAVWRLALAFAVIPPLSLLYLRIKLKEPEEFERQTMRDTKTPWLLVIKFYWWRLAIVSIIWFIYDFSAYSFGIYSSSIINTIIGETAPLWKTFGWTTLFNFFYIPGAIAGAFLSDIIGPRACLGYGVLLQGLVGFIMAGAYPQLAQPARIGGFVVIFGIFSALGELGPGDNIGLVASKTSATAVRGKYYGIAAAMGKIGAFAGSYAFPVIKKNAPTENQGLANVFYIASSLCVLSAAIALFLLPHIGQETITEEDNKFREYLIAHGYDTSTMGTKAHQAARRRSSIAAGAMGGPVSSDSRNEK
ncbi:MAG: hypothetical protein M1825_005499 [Sarcosagium campestre]|nr:MAG: hypothetical protein M1825_005499 [Sarcosagium campestre]